MKRKDHEIWLDQPWMLADPIEVYQHPTLGAIPYAHVDPVWKAQVVREVSNLPVPPIEGELGALDKWFREACAKLTGALQRDVHVEGIDQHGRKVAETLTIETDVARGLRERIEALEKWADMAQEILGRRLMRGEDDGR